MANRKQSLAQSQNIPIRFVDINGDGSEYAIAATLIGAGGSSIIIPDGADAALGAKADSAATSDTGTFSLIALFKRLLEKFTAGIGLTAGEAHVGQVGGTTILVSATPVMATAGAYISGDAVGTKFSFASALRITGGTGVLKSVKIADKAKQNATLDLILFRSDPTAGVTDNQPFDPADADILEIVAAVQVSSWYSFNDNSYGQAECSIDVASDSQDLFGVLVSRGAPTYAAGDLQVTIGILAD